MQVTLLTRLKTSTPCRLRRNSAGNKILLQLLMLISISSRCCRLLGTSTCIGRRRGHRFHRRARIRSDHPMRFSSSGSIALNFAKDSRSIYATLRSCIISARSRYVIPYLQYQRTQTRMIPMFHYARTTAVQGRSLSVSFSSSA